jgi:DNA polymerase-3 subunit gamma/tau
MFRATISSFPNAKIVNIKALERQEEEAALVALPDIDDDWDPFEES